MVDLLDFVYQSFLLRRCPSKEIWTSKSYFSSEKCFNGSWISMLIPWLEKNFQTTCSNLRGVRIFQWLLDVAYVLYVRYDALRKLISFWLCDEDMIVMSDWDCHKYSATQFHWNWKNFARHQFIRVAQRGCILWLVWSVCIFIFLDSFLRISTITWPREK